MENTTPPITSLALPHSHRAVPAGFEGPDWMDAFPCEDGEAAEQVGPTGPHLGVSDPTG